MKNSNTKLFREVKKIIEKHLLEQKSSLEKCDSVLCLFDSSFNETITYFKNEIMQYFRNKDLHVWFVALPRENIGFGFKTSPPYQETGMRYGL